MAEYNMVLSRLEDKSQRQPGLSQGKGFTGEIK